MRIISWLLVFDGAYWTNKVSTSFVCVMMAYITASWQNTDITYARLEYIILWALFKKSDCSSMLDVSYTQLYVRKAAAKCWYQLWEFLRNAVPIYFKRSQRHIFLSWNILLNINQQQTCAKTLSLHLVVIYQRTFNLVTGYTYILF